MTYEGTMVKTAIYFAVAVAAALVGALIAPDGAQIYGLVAFGLSLVVSFSKRPSPVLMGVTLATMGAAAGALSYIYEKIWGLEGIITQSLIGVSCVVVVVMFLYRSGRVRVTSKMRRFVQIAAPAFVIYTLVAIGMGVFGGKDIEAVMIPGTSIPWGIAVAALGIVIGTLMFLTNLDFIDNGVRNGLPAAYEWLAAYGLVFTVIWLYMQILRLLSWIRR